MKSSIASRSLKLLGLAAKVSRQEIKQTIKEQFAKGVDEIASGRLKSRIEQAKAIADNLSQLKGAAMKAGQLLSLDAADYFPPEAVEILSKLQGKAEPVDWSIVRRTLEVDLGEAKISELKGLSTVAAASASIGQVHKAQLNGRPVAVKIQYPGIAESIDSDLKILKTLASGMLTVTGRRIDLDELFEELTDVLHQEANYTAELEHMREYRRLLQDHTDFVVPEPIDSHSTRRVLTMTWEEGLTLNDWLKSAPPQELRENVGKMLLDLYCREFFEWGFVQTDPNYGNFLVRTNPSHGGVKLVVLDFGATLRYTPEFRQQYMALLRVLATRDRSKIVDAFLEFGMIDARESAESRRLLADMMLVSLEPFEAHRQPFRFKDDDYARRTRDVQQAFAQSLKYSAPPRKILFLHRKLGGVFLFLKKLDVQIDVTPYWAQMVGARIND
jgi:aarF domain-containing kinase